MNKNVLPFIALAAAWPAFAQNPPQAAEVRPPEPELKIHAAEPQVAAEEKVPEVPPETKQEKVLTVDAAMLAAHPELLQRVMYSAVVAQNIAGIRAVLPTYEKWPKHDRSLAKFARGLLAQADGHSGRAVAHYRELVADTPDSPVLRLQLAQALFEDRQNEAAADQFDRLRGMDYPAAVKQRIEQYREALRKRDAWQFQAGLSITHEQNINQAPEQQHLGNYLDEQACMLARQVDPADDCWRGWTFPAQIDAAAVNYQAGTEKKFSLDKGFYATAGADVYGKYYPEYSEYNDTIARVSAGFGHADQRSDIGITPFHERRIYGNRAYSYTNGARLHWNKWQTPRLQTLTALELGRLNNSRYERFDSNNRLVSASLLFQRNPQQYWLVGADLYQERNRDDRSESFNRYSLRAAWGQEWPKGISTRLNLNAAQRHHYEPSLLSGDAKRRDKEFGASVSLWHRALHYKGITPRFTFTHNRTWSNDKYYEYSKNRAFVELSKTF
ncbi:surface lipoprotein assembly modifier [Neisseria sp.]|uniref:surface lipoprotein assembly modifier n=1 Tax=Neisseria sp. TaxID=192066 RepID=UPI00359FCA8C